MYTRHFGFSEFPFTLTSDPRFFYANRVYQEAFTGVRYGIKLRHGLIVLTGESGTGKTSLVRFVKERSEPGIQVIMIAHPPGDFAALLGLIVTGAGLTETVADRDAMIESLRSYLTDQLQKKRTVALVLDEAQDLDRETLAEIASLCEDLQHDKQKLLQIVLVGRPEFEAKLRAPEFQPVKNSVGLWCRLEPLRADEIGTYIDRRLARAGYAGARLFEHEAIEQIAIYSAGIPAIINVLCDNALLAAYSDRRESVSVQTIHKAYRTVRFAEEPEVTREPATTPGRHGAPTPQGGFARRRVDANARAVSPPRRAVQSPRRHSRERSTNVFSPSTAAATAGIVLLIASAAMLYTRPSGLTRPSSRDAVSIREPASEPVGAITPGKAATQPPLEEQARLQVVNSPGRLAAPRTEAHATVYVHMSEERDQAVVEEIGAALRDSGYSVPYTRFARGRTQGDVRFFFHEDRREAERIRSVIEAELARLGYPASLQLLERDGGKFEFAAPGKIEVWLPPLRSSRS